MTSTDALGDEMSVALRAAIPRSGLDGVTFTGVRTKRYDPFPNVPIFGLDLPALIARSRSYRVALVIPVVERFSYRAAELSEALGIPGPPSAAIATLSDKALFLGMLDRSGLAGCDVLVVKTLADFERAFSGPIFVKPTRSSGSHCACAFDYQPFESAEAFKQHLLATGQMGRFLQHNNDGHEYGAHAICRFLDVADTYNVAVVTIDGRSTCVLNMRLQYAEGDRSGSAVTSRTSCPLEPDVADQLQSLVERIQTATRIDDAVWGLEYAIDAAGRVRPIEAHTRLPQSQSVLVGRMFDRFWENVLAGVFGRRYELRPLHPHCIRMTIPLPSGVIRTIRFPRDDTVFLHWCHVLRPGYFVPPVLRRPDYEASVCAVGATLEEVTARVRDYIRRIDVVYDIDATRNRPDATHSAARL